MVTYRIIFSIMCIYRQHQECSVHRLWISMVGKGRFTQIRISLCSLIHPQRIGPISLKMHTILTLECISQILLQYYRVGPRLSIPLSAFEFTWYESNSTAWTPLKQLFQWNCVTFCPLMWSSKVLLVYIPSENKLHTVLHNARDSYFAILETLIRHLHILLK